MKKVLLLSLVIMITGAFVFSQQYDIRKLKWGMPYDKVMEVEGLKTSLYKSEELLGMQVEILFGCGTQGLYSVAYQTMNAEFVIRVTPLLTKKYGEPGSDLDYSFLMESKDILKRHPKAVVDIVQKNDFTELNKIEASYSSVDERKIIKGGLAKRKTWEYGNTVALLLDNVTGGVLSYRPKDLHYANKKKFEQLVEEFKKTPKKKKKADAADNF